MSDQAEMVSHSAAAGGPADLVPASVACKICGGEARFIFDMPETKGTGDPESLNNQGPRANFYECGSCRFLFSDVLDNKPQFYETEFLQGYDKEPGSEVQYMRLLAMAAPLLGKPLCECRVLDFGSGSGAFVEMARRYIELEICGFDLALGPRQRPHILNDLTHERFDIVAAREVVEHFTDPLASFRQMRAALKRRGVITFQTNLYRPGEHGRDWDYIGAQNGHISLYSEGALAALQKELGVVAVEVWRSFPTVAAWLVERPASEDVDAPIELPLDAFRYPNPAVVREGRIEWGEGSGTTDARTIFFGPYRVMDAGVYTLHVAGEIEGEFEFVIADPSGPLGSVLVSQWTPPIVFDMPHDSWAWELVLRTTPSSRRLSIERLWLQPEPSGAEPSGQSMQPRRRGGYLAGLGWANNWAKSRSR